MARRAIAIASLFVALIGCGPQAKEPTKVPTRKAFPGCPRGTFAAELDQLLPPLLSARPVDLTEPKHVDKKIEPGCIVPFRDKAGEEALTDVGRVVVKTTKRNDIKAKPELIGRGRLQVGRAVLRLSLINDAGDEHWNLAIDGTHVVWKQKAKPVFETDVEEFGNEALPLPFDALVASLERCDGDERLGVTLDGNMVEAKRGTFPLWRMRWLDLQGASAIDTSVSCTPNDARFAWRTAAGDMLPLLVVASVRADRSLMIFRQPPSMVDDIADPALGSGVP